MSLPGTLFLIPNTLGFGHSDSEALAPIAEVIPSDVLAIAARLPYFIAENAKTTRAFLKAVTSVHPLTMPLQSIQIQELNVNTKASALPALLEPILAGQDGGLISEAGVPAVADPGADIVRLAHAKGIKIVPLVGPSSILLSIMASGLNGQSFAFNGYLPIDSGQRTKRIKDLETRSRNEKQTQVFIETPYRNMQLLEAITASCQPATLLSIAADLTLKSELVKTQTIQQWKNDLAVNKAPHIHKKPTVFLLLGQ
jgi:16S rRNA (cytidine1402-2'-O)-methyltransferase